MTNTDAAAPVTVAAVAAMSSVVEPTAAPSPPGESRSKGFLDRVAAALADLTEVKVVTIVGDVKVTAEPTPGGTTTETTIERTTVETGSIISIFKVIDGDVTTIISPDVVGNADLLAKHEAQLQTSLKVLPDHLKTLVDIVKKLDDEF
jgi:hypothetical protein